jgi:nucleotide-binding universal stress UspA family protein
MTAVAVAPVGYADSGPSAPRVIAVAFDASAESRAAVAWASRLGLEERAALKVISVVEPINRAFAMAGAGYYLELPDQEWREQCRKALSELVDSLPSELRAEERLRSGNAAEEILAECESGVDLLVVGSRGYGAVRRALLGSVSAKLIRSAPCPVVVVPGTKDVGAGKAEGELAASR